MHDYKGIIHFHSDYSHDGRVGIDAIVDAARSNRIDVLMLTITIVWGPGWQARRDGTMSG